MSAHTRLPVVRCAGRPLQRGQAHGEALRTHIQATLDRWLTALTRADRPDPRAYVHEFLEQTDYAASIASWAPDLLEEIRGIADGAAVPFGDLFAYNLLDEEWWYGQNHARPAAGCTVIGWRAAGAAPLLAQTMDIGALYDGAQAILRICPDDGPEALVLTFAGMIGLNGCNAAGVGVVVNNLAMLPHAPRGLPVAAVVRGILARTTLEDAAAFLRGAPHASGQHYAIGSPTGLLSFECAASGVAQDPTATERILHTNHPLTEAFRPADRQSNPASNSHARYNVLAARASAIATQVDVEAILMDQTAPISIACVAGRTFTFGTTSMELSVPPKLRVAPGPPHNTPFIDLNFD